MRFVARYLLMRLAWMVAAPFAYLLAIFGVCWAIDWLDRIGALNR